MRRSVGYVVLSAVAHGVSYVLQKKSTDIGMDPMAFNSFQLGVGTLPMVVYACHQRAFTTDRRIVFGAGSAGLVMLGWTTLLQCAMPFTTAGTSAFICQLSVFLVAVLDRVLFGTRITRATSIVGLFLCAGTYLLAIGDPREVPDLSSSIGLLMVTGSVVLISVDTIMTDYLLKSGASVLTFSTIQHITATLGSLVVVYGSGNHWTAGFAVGNIWLVVVTGVVNTMGFVCLTEGQRVLSATLTTIILSLESVVAALGEYIWMGTLLDAWQIGGAVTMLLSLATLSKSL
jgi:drug/metabolite transporter (DMT)-like permease